MGEKHNKDLNNFLYSVIRNRKKIGNLHGEGDRQRVERFPVGPSFKIFQPLMPGQKRAELFIADGIVDDQHFCDQGQIEPIEKRQDKSEAEKIFLAEN